MRFKRPDTSAEALLPVLRNRVPGNKERVTSFELLARRRHSGGRRQR